MNKSISRGRSRGHSAFNMGAVTAVTANQRPTPPTPPSLTILYRRALYEATRRYIPCIYGSLVTQPMGGLFLGPSIPYLPDTVNVRFFTLRLIGLGRRHLQKKTKKKKKRRTFAHSPLFRSVLWSILGGF